MYVDRVFRWSYTALCSQAVCVLGMRELFCVLRSVILQTNVFQWRVSLFTAVLYFDRKFGDPVIRHFCAAVD